MTVGHLRSDLQASRERLFAPLGALNEEQFRHVPAGEEWSVAAHLAHLLRVERTFTERAVLALTQDEPRIEATGAVNDGDPALAERLAVPQIIHGMQAARRALDDLLARCDGAMLQRTILHPRFGRMTVAQIAAKMAAHEGEHAADVERLAAQSPPTRRVIIPLAQRT
ncbi:MAG: DinB family protein [Dehalococcoidia bacterium]